MDADVTEEKEGERQQEEEPRLPQIRLFYCGADLCGQVIVFCRGMRGVLCAVGYLAAPLTLTQ